MVACGDVAIARRCFCAASSQLGCGGFKGGSGGTGCQAIPEEPGQRSFGLHTVLEEVQIAIKSVSFPNIGVLHVECEYKLKGEGAGVC